MLNSVILPMTVVVVAECLFSFGKTGEDREKEHAASFRVCR